MPDTTLFSFYVSLFLLTGFFGCSNSISFEETLSNAQEKIRSSKTIRYDYQTNWDNRFNESTFSTNAKIIYSKVDSSLYGFGFYIYKNEYELVFDGINFFEIDHEEKTILFYDSEEIKMDSNYFDGLTLWAVNPLEFLSKKEFSISFDTTIENQTFYVYKTEEITTDDDNKTKQYSKLYFVELDSSKLERIQSVAIMDGDTTQIIDHFFANSIHEDNPFDFTKIDHSETFEYEAIKEEDEGLIQLSNQINIGDTLNTKTYLDINEEEISLFGDPENKTLIMFSFIGCRGCEIALKDMKEKGYQIKDGIKMYYSSPTDKQSVLKPYLTKKGFPFTGFSKETNMNDEFGAYFFPTFVLISPEGIVEEVYNGYDETVSNLLFN